MSVFIKRLIKNIEKVSSPFLSVTERVLRCLRKRSCLGKSAEGHGQLREKHKVPTSGWGSSTHQA